MASTPQGKQNCLLCGVEQTAAGYFAGQSNWVWCLGAWARDFYSKPDVDTLELHYITLKKEVS